MIKGDSSGPGGLGWLKRLGGWWSSAPEDERRAIPRQRMRFQAQIEGAANPGMVTADGIDIHQQGAMVVSERAWVKGSVVWLELKCFRVAGYAVVRHCTPRKTRGYVTGLEFRGPLQRHETGTWEIRRIRDTESTWTETDDAEDGIEGLSWVA